MSVKSAPAAPNYTGAAQQQAASSQQVTGQQTLANRPNQTNAFGSNVSWQQGPDGSWTQTQGFGGPLGGAVNSLQGQAAQNFSTPFSFGQFGQMDTGTAARDQAISGAYNQATSRLDPQWAQRSQQMSSQLANQGLDPNSQAARAAQLQFNQGRNDAYGSAMNNAIAQGTAAQQATFGENMQARQQAEQEALTQRNMPLQEMQALQGLTAMPQFNQAGAAQATQYLPAAIAQGNYQLPAWEAQNQANADFWGGLTKFAGSVASGPFSFGGG